jgi:hypothetical protein
MNITVESIMQGGVSIRVQEILQCDTRLFPVLLLNENLSLRRLCLTLGAIFNERIDALDTHSIRAFGYHDHLEQNVSCASAQTCSQQ